MWVRISEKMLSTSSLLLSRNLSPHLGMYVCMHVLMRVYVWVYVSLRDYVYVCKYISIWQYVSRVRVFLTARAKYLKLLNALR